MLTPVPPYTCKFCGLPSWLEPIDQTPPPDYCHPEDHGEPDDDFTIVEPTQE